jgi:hypothetical protein
MTRQNKTRQDMKRQDRSTRHNKTRQDKTRLQGGIHGARHMIATQLKYQYHMTIFNSIWLIIQQIRIFESSYIFSFLAGTTPPLQEKRTLCMAAPYHRTKMAEDGRVKIYNEAIFEHLVHSNSHNNSPHQLQMNSLAQSSYATDRVSPARNKALLRYAACQL